MGVVFRQTAKATLVSYFGASIGAFSVLYLYPKCLSPEQIGLTRVLLEAALFFSFFAQIGISGVIVKFFPLFKNTKNSNSGFFSFILAVPFVGFLLFILLFFLFRDRITAIFSYNSPLLIEYIYYIIPLTFFILYISVFETYSSVLHRIVVPKMNKEIVIRLLTIIIILLYYFHYINFNWFVIYFVSIYALSCFINFIYLHALESVELSSHRQLYRHPLMKDIIWFMIYMLIAGSGTNLANRIDTFMISKYIGLGDMGIYTIAIFIASFIEIPSRPAFQITAPFISEALKNNQIDTVENIYKKMALNQLIIGGLLLLLIWANVENIFRIMPNGQIYKEGKFVILFIGIGKVVDAATGVNSAILGYSKYYYYSMIFIFFLAILAILNNLWFIPLYGITGAAMATCITLILYNLFIVLFIKIKLKIQPFSVNTLKSILILLACFVLNAFFPPFDSPYLDAIIRSSLIIIIFSMTILYLKTSDDLNMVFNLVYNKIEILIFRKDFNCKN